MAARKPKAPEIEPFTITVVEWEDAYANATGQYATVEEARDSYQPIIRRSVGYFVSENDQVIILATDDDRTSANRTAVAGLMYIPKALVRRPPIQVGKTKVVFK